MPRNARLVCAGCGKSSENSIKHRATNILLRLFVSARSSKHLQPQDHKGKGIYDKLLNGDLPVNDNDDNEIEERVITNTVTSDRATQTDDDQPSVNMCCMSTRPHISNSCAFSAAKKTFFFKRGIFVPAGARCCRLHLYNKQLTYESIQQISASQFDKLSLGTEDVQNIILDFRSVLLNVKTFDFDDPTSLSDESYFNFTGLRKAVIGPFLADGKNNDASIAKHILYNNDQGILEWLHDDDIIIVDRGFRDAVKAIEMFGFHSAMPRFLNGKKQFSTADANYSRCVTKSRWAVESANGKIKQFKYFNEIIQNSAISFVSDYLHIVCAIINAYLVPAIKDSHAGKEMATEMLNLLVSENALQKRLTELTNIKWKKYDAKMCLFPILTIDDIRRYCFATVQFANYQDESIQGWYCTCPTGARVVGCCAHTAALLWYLGVCRAEYDDKGHPLSAQYLLETVDDCIQYAETIETDDEEEGEVKYHLASDHSDSNSDSSDD
ncbi:unnamed protein product [Rotaria sp. Silwood2]|nr:unnamed protein product [Rotaria sp. Silwood2]CAF4602102.1 unnamed protein product [Rotaria sp. Silwood2]CAF4716386.1 unnamed protein product [Rotaria sp. Silwood2]